MDWTIYRTSFNRANMPYLLILDGKGIVRYRIDKRRNGPASTASFYLHRCDGSGAYHGKALTWIDWPQGGDAWRGKLVIGITEARRQAKILMKRGRLMDAVKNDPRPHASRHRAAELAVARAEEQE
jgi:hypothetical protein